MGSGAPRELGGPQQELPPVPADLSTKLTFALAKLDQLNAPFKQARDDERSLQTNKAWNAKCKEIDAHLRLGALVLINSHQLSLDIGSDGGGIRTAPWTEETAMAFAKLSIKVEEDGSIAAVSDGETILSGKMEDIDYDWVLKAMIEWAVKAVLKKG